MCESNGGNNITCELTSTKSIKKVKALRASFLLDSCSQLNFIRLLQVLKLYKVDETQHALVNFPHHVVPQQVVRASWTLLTSGNRTAFLRQQFRNLKLAFGAVPLTRGPNQPIKFKSVVFAFLTKNPTSLKKLFLLGTPASKVCLFDTLQLQYV